MKWHKNIPIVKDPDSVLDWAWDYGDDPWLEPGDSLSDHAVIAEDGITIDSSEIRGDRIVVWLSGGTSGESYTVTVRAVTTDGRSVDRTVTFVITPQ